MSNDSPPIEQQRFARSQTPESPRPVHVPEPAKIPVLLNQMDPSSNDLATYNIPTDQTFAHYGDSLENPAYKSSPNQEESDPFRDFLRNADNAVASHLNPHPHLDPNPVLDHPNTNVSSMYTNQAGLLLSTGHLVPNSNIMAAPLQHANSAQAVFTLGQMHSGNTLHSGDRTINEFGSKGEEQAKSKDAREQTTTHPATATIDDVEAKSDAGVDYQSLLDTITQSASTAPAAENVVAPTTEAIVPDSHTSSLPTFPGLPPKPPPLETQSVFSTSIDHAQAQSQPLTAPVEVYASQQSIANSYPSFTNQTTSSTTQGEGSGAQSTIPNPFDVAANDQAMIYAQQNADALSSANAMEPADRPWSPKTQAVYDQFLEAERHYVTEGIWDRFPAGSRLFVGNLPSEKVTKRDLFHRFHRHGKLAQISIKQAYGFVQYHDAQSCKAALDAEQGIELRGRKVHLEVSKPQKGSKAANPPSKASQPRRRSRSPQRRSWSDYRDEPGRRRDDYRNRRSPSPRGYRRDERPTSRDERRSPMHSSNFSTPQPLAFDDEANLPYPRRDPRYVPDVQIIVLDAGVNQAFVNWIEDGFKRKGLNAASTWLNQRTPLPAVVKRQIMEGVQAVVKIGSPHQTRSKIPLQVFDRSAGTSNVTFNEYVDLDVSVAADVVMQARQKERNTLQPPRPPYPPALMPPQSPYQHSSPSTPWAPQPPNIPQYPPQHTQYPQQPTQHYGYQPQPQQAYRPQPYPTPGSAAGQPPNLHELLANLKGGAGASPTPQSAHSTGQPYTPYGQPPPPQYYGQPAYAHPMPPQQQQQNGTGPPNVQNIMDQLARYQRS